MKNDLRKKQSKFAERVMADLYYTLFSLLQEKGLENITVNEICAKANYPRATFYNYFDDIYDLLDYCWNRIRAEILIGDYQALAEKERTAILFSRCYDYLENKRTVIHRIMKSNPEDGRFTESMKRALRGTIYQIIINCPCSVRYRLPYDMISQHYANTIQMVLEWSFFKDGKMNKDDALSAVEYLLEGL